LSERVRSTTEAGLLADTLLGFRRRLALYRYRCDADSVDLLVAGRLHHFLGGGALLDYMGQLMGE
jgi:hypothetical protein